MKATELVGKNAIRRRHVNIAGGGVDRSYMDSPIHIVAATDDHIICSWPKHPHLGKHILPYEWCDDNWIDYDCLMFLAEAPRSGAENLSEVA
jgi:hypothetical protein